MFNYVLKYLKKGEKSIVIELLTVFHYRAEIFEIVPPDIKTLTA